MFLAEAWALPVQVRSGMFLMIGHWWSFLPGIEPSHTACWVILDSLCSWADVDWWFTEIYPTQLLVP